MLTLIAKAILSARWQTSDIADLMDLDPHGWSYDTYHAVHKDCKGFNVWVANSVYGLHVDVHGERWVPTWAERQVIYSAFRRVKYVVGDSQSQAVRDEVRAFIDKGKTA